MNDEQYKALVNNIGGALKLLCASNNLNRAVIIYTMADGKGQEVLDLVGLGIDPGQVPEIIIRGANHWYERLAVNNAQIQAEQAKLAQEAAQAESVVGGDDLVVEPEVKEGEVV